MVKNTFSHDVIRQQYSFEIMNISKKTRFSIKIQKLKVTVPESEPVTR
jgi:hypothetical protein